MRVVGVCVDMLSLIAPRSWWGQGEDPLESPDECSSLPHCCLRRVASWYYEKSDWRVTGPQSSSSRALGLKVHTSSPQPALKGECTEAEPSVNMETTAPGSEVEGTTGTLASYASAFSLDGKTA